ncbi:MAG: glutaredoxin domain-containing protein [Promethearchaeota archaeon]
MVKVEIFSGPQCTHCAKAKALLDQNDILTSTTISQRTNIYKSLQDVCLV